MPKPATAKALLLFAALALPAPMSWAPASAGQAEQRRQDLADTAAGSYAGDVISDARGASRSGVRIIVTKIGPNRIRVSSDYARLPSFEAALTRAMDTIQNSSGDEVFLLDLSRRPATLHVTVDDASWAGVRE